MSVTGIGAPGAPAETDRRRVVEAVAFVRDRGTGDALAAVVGDGPAASLSGHLELAHAAVLVDAARPVDVIRALADLGVVASEPCPSGVVRGRAGQEFDVRVVCGAVGAREVRLLVPRDGSALSEADREAGSHVAFRVTGDDVVLRGVCETLREAGLAADGGDHDGQAATFYFRGASRLAVRADGHHAELLERHVGRPDQPRRTMLDLMTGAWRTRAVAAAAELGIADLLADGPRDTADLAARTGTRPDKLRRVLAYLAGLGVLRRDGERWALTEAGTMLRGDVAGSQRDLARIYGGLFYRSFSGLEHALRTGESGFRHVYGAQPFEHFAAHPADARLFEGAMAAGTAFLELVPGLLDLPASGTVIDVGGGDGRLLDLVLTAAPGLRGVLFDRPHVAGAATEVLAAHGARASVVAGDFFHDPVPRGGDLYLLSRIMHDWDDERCSTILRNVRAAMAEGATLAVVERPIQDDPRTLLPLAFNVHMMVNTVQGGERTTEEHRRLLAANGFALEDLRELPLDMAVLVARATV
ncbi:acetylserotonin O-methyltransferase [Saccharothrix sp. S26]|uniref:acetylserotonin O-methyltransferase n=1 Tax=Saccharothrix sp. S26 TaxID=2907215 RepID=UPI001F44DE37|nr:acetylserotonin O-methyltransferase [Saccharothrix sp. S26]MCE6997460.1 acetylserotonin O-methyltransferase [Saccharothrix sp. S26]